MNRTRRQDKAATDLETQHRLWIIRIQELVGAGLTPRRALDQLTEEATTWITEKPERKAARTIAWHAFIRRIPKPQPQH